MLVERRNEWLLKFLRPSHSKLHCILFAFSHFEYKWYSAFSVFSRKIWHMTKILRKREGRRWIPPPAAPVSLRLEAKVVTMTYRAPWDVQCPCPHLITCCVSPSLTLFKTWGPLGTSISLPPQDLCTCCSLSQEFCFPICSSPSPPKVTSRMPPVHVRFKVVPPAPCPSTSFSAVVLIALSDAPHILLIYFVDCESLPPSPHREFRHYYFPSTQTSVWWTVYAQCIFVRLLNLCNYTLLLCHSDPLGIRLLNK